MKTPNTLWALLVLASLFSCQNSDKLKKAENPEFLHRSIRHVNEIIIYDIFTPPVASRIYAYAAIAGYEAGRHLDPNTVSTGDQINDLGPIPQPEPNQEYCFPLASVQAIFTVTRALTFSESAVDEFRASMLAEFKALPVPEDVFNRSVAYGEAVAQKVLARAKRDGYAETRSASKFTGDLKTRGRWQPTPPDYKDGVEPAWMRIRPFTLDSANQCIAMPPLPFSSDSTSDFYRSAMEVYQSLNTSEASVRQEIAYFWDDNPFVSEHSGHMMRATKKVTPGGHWMNIAMLASRMSKADFVKSAEAYLYTALGLADGFISCWNTKYQYQYIRPETFINQYIDPAWRPFLQTPPFPEYTSGHSVISMAAAINLTHVFGDNFAFTDTTNVEFGRPARNFTSFVNASTEAGISRLYGGIHFSQALVEGAKEGRLVGEIVKQRIKTRKG